MSRRSPLRPIAVALAAVIVSLAAGKTEPAPAASAMAAGEWRTFEGTWTAAGDRRALDAPPDQTAVVLDLSGSILLTGERGIGTGFPARLIAYSDGATTAGRAVWTDDRGDQIFSAIRGQPIATGQRISGTFTGGTGRWSGINGEYAFDWKYLVNAADGRTSGRVEDLRGRARIVKPEVGRR